MGVFSFLLVSILFLYYSINGKVVHTERMKVHGLNHMLSYTQSKWSENCGFKHTHLQSFILSRLDIIARLVCENGTHGNSFSHEVQTERIIRTELHTHTQANI